MDSFAHKRSQILQQMEQIQSMEQGSLQEERRPSRQDPELATGPYFKHQVWEKGKNQTRRVPSEEAGRLAEAIDGRKQFEALAREFVTTTVAQTRARQPRPGLKKNATNSKRLSTRKRRA